MAPVEGTNKRHLCLCVNIAEGESTTHTHTNNLLHGVASGLLPQQTVERHLCMRAVVLQVCVVARVDAGVCEYMQGRQHACTILGTERERERERERENQHDVKFHGLNHFIFPRLHSQRARECVFSTCACVVYMHTWCAFFACTRAPMLSKSIGVSTTPPSAKTRAGLNLENAPSTPASTTPHLSEAHI